MPGIRTSTMRHEVSCSWPEVRNISADSKAAVRKPKDSIRRVVVLRMDSSSSMIEMKFPAAPGSSPNSCKAKRMPCSNCSSLKGFPRNAMAPACMARRRDSLSSRPVMKMMGMLQPAAASWLCSCSPFMPGMCTSTMKHEVSFRWPELRKLSADSKPAARKPNDSMSREVVLRTDSSSSMTEIKFFATMGPPVDPSYLQMHKESIGHWWILRPRKDNAGNALVYQGWGGAFVLLEALVTGSMQISAYNLHGSTEDSSLSIIFTSSATDCARIFSIARLR